MIETWHRHAMELAEQADAAGGDRTLLRRAFELERDAALLALKQHVGQPSQAVLLRSAASLAFECELYAEARQLVDEALSDETAPGDIVAELHQLRDELNGRTRGAP